MFSLFARPKPCRIILTLKANSNNNWYLSNLAKATETTYVYVTTLMSRLESKGFVTIAAQGKKRMVRLTEKGMMIATSLEDLRKRFEQ